MPELRQLLEMLSNKNLAELHTFDEVEGTIVEEAIEILVKEPSMHSAMHSLSTFLPTTSAVSTLLTSQLLCRNHDEVLDHSTAYVRTCKESVQSDNLW